MRGAVLSAALILASVSAAARANGIVVSARGPDANLYPSGTRITEGQKIRLRATTTVNALGKAGIYIFRGPGTFVFGAPSKRVAFNSLYAARLADPAAKIPRNAAMRGFAIRRQPRQPAAMQRDWRDLDIAGAGPFCFTSGATLHLWRSAAAEDASIELEQIGGPRTTLSFRRGEHVKPWASFHRGAKSTPPGTPRGFYVPEMVPIPINDASFRIYRNGLFDREIAVVPLGPPDADPLALTGKLIDAGCTTQAELLFAQADQTAPDR